MRILFLILGNAWMLPNTLISAIYLAVFWALGWVRALGLSEWAVVLTSVQGSWLARRGMRGWNGWASGVFVVVRYDKEGLVGEVEGRTLAHEERHVQQQMMLGVLQPILYILTSVLVWCCFRLMHSYYDNGFETDARLYAGQQAYIPKSQWKTPGDRWIWW